ncbi:hypothetical protein [Burkholderia sp. Bp8992]|nr:hypothetical protein [Burkholderia sp. Bp8992]
MNRAGVPRQMPAPNKKPASAVFLAGFFTYIESIRVNAIDGAGDRT